jgi:hypothetical protein
MILLSTAYLPPIQYISKFLLGEPVSIERFENYQKQSYRNRCYIYGANGIQCLVIPVKKNHGEKTAIGDIAIDYTCNWQKIHLKSIESAYRLSPFYEYYVDDLLEIFNEKVPFLFDWNLRLLETILPLLCIENHPEVTLQWEPITSRNGDYRQHLHPKKRLNIVDSFQPVPYQQVFQERFGFIPNLSIIDLLFNEGSVSRDILGKGIMR